MYVRVPVLFGLWWHLLVKAERVCRYSYFYEVYLDLQDLRKMELTRHTEFPEEEVMVIAQGKVSPTAKSLLPPPRSSAPPPPGTPRAAVFIAESQPLASSSELYLESTNQSSTSGLILPKNWRGRFISKGVGNGIASRQRTAIRGAEHVSFMFRQLVREHYALQKRPQRDIGFAAVEASAVGAPRAHRALWALWALWARGVGAQWALK